MTRVATITAAIALATVPALAQQAPVQQWRAEGFQAPESVAHDATLGLFYVSNINGQPTEKDGNGFISRLSPDGTVLDERWVARGLDGPKGMDVADGRLYVADIDRLVVIDIASGHIEAAHEARGAQFLNDVTVDDRGNVYVSDMMANAIWRLAPDGGFEQWLRSDALMSPNGLKAMPEHLVVASWGERTEGFETTRPGNLHTVSYDDKAVAPLGSGEPVGNLDGVEPDGTGAFLVTDWMAGTLYRITPDGAATQLLDLPQGSADLEYLPDPGLAVIPLMNDDQVAAFRFEPPQVGEQR